MAGIATLALAYIMSQFYRSFMAVLTPALTAELGATKAELSLASGAWFIAFALMQFIVGVSLDRYGPRVTAALLLGFAGSGGAFLFAAATAPWMIVLSMIFIGIGCSPVLMASYFLFARLYHPAKFAMLASWMVGFGSAGNVIGASPLANAAEAFGWRPVMAGLAAVTLLISVMIWFTVRDPREPEEGRPQGGFAGYLDLMTIRWLWPIIPLVAVNNAAAAGIRGLWAGPYMADLHGADALAIGHVTLMMAIAMVAGNFIYGPLDRLFGTRKWVAVAGCVIAVSAIAYLALNPRAGAGAVTAAFVVIGLAGSSYGLMMAHARAFVPAHLTGRGVTLMNFFAIGGTGVMQFVTGWVVTAAADPGRPEASWQALWTFYAVLLGGALLIYLTARDAKPAKA
ncbi:MAG: MFS transporter [Notoacmeibacter sp.]|nr:MFS transporter [Notoacmeibacter sp.]MCC0031791.1 MFS transporter [Brucellaceae bacterium]